MSKRTFIVTSFLLATLVLIFTISTGVLAAEATYVGAAQCAKCHSTQYKGWQETLHTRMVQDAKKPGVLVGDFTKSGQPFEIAQGLSKNDIVYTLGSKWKQRYIVKKDGAYRILPKEWIVATGEWKDYNVNTWATKAWEDTCITCHATGYNPASKTFVDNGTSCEACHGPGGNHVKTLKKADIINPARLSAKQQVDVCGSCHYRGENLADPKREDNLGFRPGDELAKFVKWTTSKPGEDTKDFWPDGTSKRHHQQYQDFIQSKHYASGVTCTTCHTPHGLVGGKQLVADFDSLCAKCHGDKKFDIDKVMPKTAKSATPNDIRSHLFRQ